MSELDVIVWLQQWAGGYQAAEIFSALGDPLFFMVLLPLVYWLLDKRAGRTLALAFALAVYVNWTLKLLIGAPRPFEVDSRILRLVEDAGPGLPSGHAQLAVVVWGYLAWHFRRWWLTALCAGLLVVIPLARFYLGLHFLADLAAGYGIGAMLLALTVWLEPCIARWTLPQQAGAWAGVSLSLLGLNRYFQHALLAVAAGMFMGAGAGFMLEARWVRAPSPTTWYARGLCYGLGVGGLFLLSHTLPGSTYLVYTMIGLWVAVWWPALWLTAGRLRWRKMMGGADA